MRVEDPQESTKRYFRADKRLFVLNSAWYFSTREGEVGPFPSREVAESELERFKREMSELQGFQKTRAAARDALDKDSAAANASALTRRPKRQPPRDPKLQEVLV